MYLKTFGKGFRKKVEALVNTKTCITRILLLIGILSQNSMEEAAQTVWNSSVNRLTKEFGKQMVENDEATSRMCHSVAMFIHFTSLLDESYGLGFGRENLIMLGRDTTDAGMCRKLGHICTNPR